MAGKEVEMTDAPALVSADVSPAEVKSDTTSQLPSAASQLQSSVELITKTVQSKETRSGLGRLMRQTATVRKHLNPDVLMEFFASALPAGHATRSTLESHMRKAAAGMDIDDKSAVSASDKAAPLKTSTPADPLPEVEAFAFLLAMIYLLDSKLTAEAQAVGEAALARLAAFNRRTLDVIASRIYFYLSLAHERLKSLASIRSVLLGLHRTSVLRHDEVGQEVLLNLLLRNYLHYNLYDQAEALRSKAQRPETARQQQQLARYLYYLGRIQAVQLDYTDAKDSLQQAARKAPTSASGFRVEVQKWLVLVRLLLGEVPEREELVEPGLEGPLRPYFQITNAVRIGDLTAFKTVAEEHAAVFLADKTANLVVRLRHNVIRTGLRRINLAYSRISLADVAQKLGLGSVEDTECIVAKAIRDGGIEASIDHEGSWLASKELADVYSTEEPQAAFHARVAFCLDVHNEAVKAMRFEVGTHKGRVETEEARLERVKAEAELQEALQEAHEEED